MSSITEKIQGNATDILCNAETVAPDPDEIAAMKAYKAGDPEYQPSMSQTDLMKELGL